MRRKIDLLIGIGTALIAFECLAATFAFPLNGSSFWYDWAVTNVVLFLVLGSAHLFYYGFSKLAHLRLLKDVSSKDTTTP